MGNKSSYTIRAISRAAKLIKCFSFDKEELSLVELSKMLGLHKSTIHRIVKSLEEEDILVKNSIKETYSLGMVIFQLGNIVRHSLELRAVALPVMQELVFKTKETVFLSVLSDSHKICIEKINGPQGLRPAIQIGQALPAHVGSSGKALLAYLDEKSIEAILKKNNLQNFTGKTITDLNTLKNELAVIREKGYAVGIEERTIGGAGVSAPIWGYSGKVVASLSIVGPVERIRQAGIDEIASLLVDAAQKISINFGGGDFFKNFLSLS
jgi:IclR family transcriptional regulator, KDG regulon repressor